MINNINNDCCNICDSLNYRILYTELEYSYSICKDCGHVYQSNRKSQNFYNNIPYKVAQELVTKVDMQKYDSHVKNRSNYIYDFIYDLIKNKQIKNLLDIGSGYGGVSYYLNKKLKINNVVGITPDYDEYTFNVYKGIKFIKSTYDEPINGKFDLVILVHTLEHFIFPLKSLSNIKENLNEDGLLYIELPNFFWEKSIIGKSYSSVHLSYFTKNDLINILEYSGFKILKIKESKFWGNIKVVAKHDKNRNTNNKNIFKTNKENWILKLIKFNLNQIFMYPIYKFIKRYYVISPNS